MKCLEFKRLALSDPFSGDVSFISHRDECPDCLQYVDEVRLMDADLAKSVNIKMPGELVAKLQLNQELSEGENSGSNMRRYAIAAGVVLALFVGGFVVSNQILIDKSIGKDYESLLAGVIDHMNEQPITPVWENARANRTVNALLASYDGKLQFKQMHNLQFGRICPMGRYTGLHASLNTHYGQITFAYIKGEALTALLDASYQGYVTRVKPVRGGNLLIISRSQESLDQADNELERAMYWDI